MRKLIVIAMTSVFAAVCSHAQVSTNIPNFFQQMATWGTTFNTNADHNWTNTTLQFSPNGSVTAVAGTLGYTVSYQGATKTVTVSNYGSIKVQ